MEGKGASDPAPAQNCDAERGKRSGGYYAHICAFAFSKMR
ncbi:hypothetical protein GMO_11220 [Gluconobacter morbifer G707]|uniref:Uncharacterized protein n=1 Tax=Gluconobacter morbifer G707 TaxID=1088869 RepID=G6XHX8_9PROT|nr:hypothetical protein GMO_11220 [Gluconobacter morbifer G707]